MSGLKVSTIRPHSHTVSSVRSARCGDRSLSPKTEHASSAFRRMRCAPERRSDFGAIRHTPESVSRSPTMKSMAYEYVPSGLSSSVSIPHVHSTFHEPTNDAGEGFMGTHAEELTNTTRVVRLSIRTNREVRTQKFERQSLTVPNALVSTRRSPLARSASDRGDDWDVPARTRTPRARCDTRPTTPAAARGRRTPVAQW